MSTFNHQTDRYGKGKPHKYYACEKVAFLVLLVVSLCVKLFGSIWCQFEIHIYLCDITLFPV